MTRATKALPTPERDGVFDSYPVKAAATIWAGTIVALDATGYAVPASKTAGLTVVGRAEETVANTATGASDGDEQVRVKRGVFRWAKAAAETPDRASVGKDAFADDDNTVATTAANNRPKAGVFTAVDDNWAWVRTG